MWDRGHLKNKCTALFYPQSTVSSLHCCQPSPPQSVPRRTPAGEPSGCLSSDYFRCVRAHFLHLAAHWILGYINLLEKLWVSNFDSLYIESNGQGDTASETAQFHSPLKIRIINWLINSSLFRGPSACAKELIKKKIDLICTFSTLKTELSHLSGTTYTAAMMFISILSGQAGRSCWSGY